MVVHLKEHLLTITTSRESHLAPFTNVVMGSCVWVIPLVFTIIRVMQTPTHFQDKQHAQNVLRVAIAQLALAIYNHVH